MFIEPKDEYVALRAEMLLRFGRIFDIVKIGPAGIIAVLAFKPTDLHPIAPTLILDLIQCFLISMTLVAINEFKHIYRIGTYIAIACEGCEVNGWIRMSRSFGSFLGSDAYVSLGGDPAIHRRKKRPFPWGERWGEDPSVFAMIMLVLSLLSWIYTGLTATFAKSAVLELLLSGALTALLLYLLYWLRSGIGPYRQQMETAWELHFRGWRARFPDPYAGLACHDEERSN
jgi:hypothetical protein